MKIKAILAMSKDLVVGYKDGLAWKIPADMKFFKKITTGNTLLMGSTTVLGMIKNWPPNTKFLPGREVIVLTHNKNRFLFAARAAMIGKKFSLNNVFVLERKNSFASLIIDKAKSMVTLGDLYICGGKTIYESFLYFADEVYLTMIYDRISDRYQDKENLCLVDERFLDALLTHYPVSILGNIAYATSQTISTDTSIQPYAYFAKLERLKE